MDEKTYSSKILKLIIYLFIFLLALNLNEVISRNFLVELDGVNYILILISIPCSILYYILSMNDENYIFILIYINILIEYIISMNFVKHNIATTAELVTPFIFRTILILMIFFKKKNIIRKYKIPLVIGWSILSIFMVLFDYFVDFKFKQSYIFLAIYIFLTIYSYFILWILFIRSIKKYNFIQTIYVSNLLLLGFRIFFSTIRFIYGREFYSLMLLDKIFFSIAFSSLVLGVFIETKYLLMENNKLTKHVKNISHDIEEYKVMENLRSQFFANMSHEFKTPLNIIFSCTQLLDSKSNDDFYELGVSYNKYSKTIKQNCYRMIRLTNNIVDMTKIESGHMNINFHNYDIINLIENIVMSVVPYFEQKKLNLIFDTTVEELKIKCDSDSIERIILNLLSNSIKFSNPFGTVLVFIDVNETDVIIKVSDDGIGIEEDKQDTIFDVFVQGDKSLTRKKEGSGIGLSLVKSLVHIHDGEIFLNSKIDVGTEIIIKLPNIRLENDVFTDDNIYTTQNKITSKINIEFSDIYDLY